MYQIYLSNRKLQDRAWLIVGESFLQLYNFTFTTLWAYSADDKLMIFFLFSPGNSYDISCNLQIVLHEIKPIFLEK